MKKISVFVIIIFIILTSISYAENGKEKIEAGVEKSEEYKKWESLTDVEKENVIIPNYSNISIESSVKKSTLNNLLKAGASTLPKSYDLRTTLPNINEKDQKGTFSCWAFSFTSMMETTMAKKYKKNNLEYSPMHIDYKTSQIFNRKVGEGGSHIIALSYAASGYGPVYEQDFPFERVYDEEENSEESYYLSDIENVDLNQKVREKVKDATYFASIYKAYSDNSITYKDSTAFSGYNKYNDEQVAAMRNLIKQHIKEDGAVTATFYADSMAGLTQNGEYRSIYFNNEKNAYYYTNILPANHAVTIVGWDDDYKKENFSSEVRQPIHDGAYIVLNSWGPQFADGGYFYVSYDDAVIEQSICSINEIEEISEEDNKKLYEYDQLGMNYAIYSLDEENTKFLDSGYAANVYSRDNFNSSKYEYLTEVGVFLQKTEGVEVYVNAINDDFNNCVKVASYIGSNALETGYHTIKLNSPILLKGNKFTIKIKYTNSDVTTIPLECNFDDSQLSDNQISMYSKAKSNKGESFVSMDGTKWTDLFDYKLNANTTLKNTNACIKATTMTTDTPLTISVTDVKVDNSNITMEVGDTQNLIVTIEPADSTNKNVIWKSKDENIVTVSDTGILKALKKGKTTITVTSVDGNYSASCEVTVTEKTNNEDDIYIPKDDLTIGDTENIQDIKNKQNIQIKTENSDNTLATKILPNTGKEIIIATILFVIVILIIAFVKYRRMKDVK